MTLARGINEAIVIRSRSVTWRVFILAGTVVSDGVGYGGAPDVRYTTGAVGSSNMAGIAAAGLPVDI